MTDETKRDTPANENDDAPETPSDAADMPAGDAPDELRVLALGRLGPDLDPDVVGGLVTAALARFQRVVVRSGVC